jgi:hypothetical protein
MQSPSACSKIEGHKKWNAFPLPMLPTIEEATSAGVFAIDFALPAVAVGGKMPSEGNETGQYARM